MLPGKPENLAYTVAIRVQLSNDLLVGMVDEGKSRSSRHVRRMHIPQSTECPRPGVTGTTTRHQGRAAAAAGHEWTQPASAVTRGRPIKPCAAAASLLNA